MANKNSDFRNQDIYRSEHRSRDWVEPSSSSAPAKAGTGSGDLPAEVRKYRITVTLLSLAVLVCTALMIGVAARYYLRISALETRAPSTSGSGGTSGSGYGILDPVEHPDQAFMLESIAAIPPTLERPEDDRPVTGFWVKQVALLVVQAEKAQKIGDTELALEQYQEAARIFPDMQGIYGPIGLSLMKQKVYDQAAVAFQRALEEDAVNHGIANNLGAAYMQLEQYPPAEEALQQALKIKPVYAAAQFNLANLYLKTGRMDDAAEQFRQYLEVRPTDFNAAHSYAFVLIKLEKWEQAATILGQISSVHQESAPVFFRLAQALSHTDYRQRAFTALRRGSELVDARQALSWLARKEFDDLREEEAFTALVAELSAPPDG